MIIISIKLNILKLIFLFYKLKNLKFLMAPKKKPEENT